MLIKKLLSTCLSLLPACFCVVMLSAFQRSQPAVSFAAPVNGWRDTVPLDDTVPRIYEQVEIEASFPGGEDGWRDFLATNLNPNVPVDNGAPAGRYTVMILFIVNRNGTISGIKALTHHGYGMEAEVMRILRKSPPWTPAVQNNRKVNAYRKQPVTFQVIEEKRKKRRS